MTVSRRAALGLAAAAGALVTLGIAAPVFVSRELLGHLGGQAETREAG